MRILLVHNFYQQAGGEDVVFKNESTLLQRYGHDVFHYTANNQDLQQTPNAVAALETIWSRTANQQLRAMLQEVKPDIVHFHNTFMRISPGAYYVCQSAKVPVVQTLHNYRLLCPAGTCYRDGSVCEECLQQWIPRAGIRHACYRQSRSQSAIVTAMLTAHRWLKTWESKVDLYIALTQFAHEKFIKGGLPAAKLVTKPNFVDLDPGQRACHGTYALFVGRLAPEKGILLLLQAWTTLTDIPLKIVGDGPMRAEVEAFSQSSHTNCIEIVGRQPRETIFSLMKDAAFLVFPSGWYEGFPMTIAEAYACGLPVVGTNLGSIAEIIENGYTGLHFTPNDANDLANKVRWAWDHPLELIQMGKAARQQYEKHYTAEQNYRQLLTIYEKAISAKQREVVAPKQDMAIKEIV